ncbi:glycoside hydrolase superfamily [Mycena latifolia]|nr:glycoside hydrolase superfamily [Mycena latifolia]
MAPRMNLKAFVVAAVLRVICIAPVLSSSQASSSIAHASSATTASSTLAASSPVATVTAIPTSTAVSGGASLPPVGSIPRDFSPAGLERLWDLVGPVQPPPFTTTRVPTSTRVVLPSPPPPLYPAFYAPAPKDILPGLKFPAGFKFGVATASYQVEGAAKDEGKGPTVWDWNGHQPGGVQDNTTGDVVDLQYYLYKEDVVRVAALGVNAHSFSISWARILPFGTADSPINEAGLKHYSDLIHYHIQNGVEPVATLFHWDLPLAIATYYGGFTSPEVVDDFIHYAKTVFAAYNGTVKTWYTFNEPRVYCALVVYPPFTAFLAPGVNASTAPYQCSYFLLKAHAGAVKAFREMKIVGEISLKNDDFTGIPWRSNTTEDALAVERHAAFRIGVFSDPLYTTGDWPKILTDTLSPEYLPRFTEAEKKDNLGSADFYAIDSYREQWAVAPAGGIDACVANFSHPLWPECHDVVLFDSNAGWAAGPSADPLSAWLQATPNTIRGYFKDLHARWPSKKIYISEFGFSEPFEGSRTDLFSITEDVGRTNYYMTYLGQILLSIHEDKVPIAGAFAWAMIDNAEWVAGTSDKFGIQYVNYTTLERTYKRSALSLSEFFKAHLQ